MNSRDNYQKPKAFRPFDSLIGSTNIKFTDVTQNRKDYVHYDEYIPAKLFYWLNFNFCF